MCYLLGSNWGTVDYDYYPRAFCPGGSFIIDYTGMMLRHANYPSEQVIGATIDIEALREHRSRCGHNCWVDVRTEGFKQIYENPIYPPNQFPPGKPPRTLADKMGPLDTVFKRHLRSWPVHAARRHDGRGHAEAAPHARRRRPGSRHAEEERLGEASGMRVKSDLADLDIKLGRISRQGDELVVDSAPGSSLDARIRIDVGGCAQHAGQGAEVGRRLGFPASPAVFAISACDGEPPGS